MTLAAGTRLGPYEVQAPLGAGGMGEVYKARDTRLSREVAIKVLPAEVASDGSRLKRFEKEARATSALNHPNIVTIYDIGETGSTHWIAMERVEGKTLRETLFGGALPMRKLLPIAAQIADGLARAHEAGIVHRDLKPENVMLTKDGLVKILDFGLAKLTATGSGSDEGSQLPTETGTSPGMMLGTVGYMSPEQAGAQPVDFRSDQFSLGSILYELATGKRAFQEGTAVDTLSAILHDEPRPINEINPEAPAPLRWIVERCLAKEPQHRYASTTDLARDLGTMRDRLSEAVSEPSIARAVPRRGRRVLGVAAAVVVVAALVGALLLGKKVARVPQPRFQQLTFRHGMVGGYARFAPQSQTIVYSASWEDQPPDVYTTLPGSLESRPLGLRGVILSVSSLGDMAVSLGPPRVLAQVPLAGGAPRELVKDVLIADWAPDGKSLAIVRPVEGKFRLEYPIGNIVYESTNWIGNLHVSPEGNQLAFEERGQDIVGAAGTIFGLGHEVFIFDVPSKTKKATGIAATEFGWAPRSGELWFLRNSNELCARSSGGRESVIARFPGFYQLDDVGRDGRLLLERLDIPRRVQGLVPGAARERSLSWLDSSWAVDLSNDGRLVLLNEEDHNAIYLRKTDGSPAVPLGEGTALALSPGGDWVLARRTGPLQLLLVPAGAGETRVLNTPGFQSVVAGSFLPDGKRVLFSGTESGHRRRLYLMDIQENKARPVSPEGVQLFDIAVKCVSPDGRLAFAWAEDRGWLLYPLDGRDGASPLPIAGLAQNDAPVGWTADSQSLFVQDGNENPASVFRLNWKTGRRELFHEFRPADPTGIRRSIVLVTPDGKSWVYSYVSWLSQLYLVDGLQ